MSRFDAPRYMVNKDMSADVEGEPFTPGPVGDVIAEISWAATGSPVGNVLLEYLSIGGVTWKQVPGSSSSFSSQPNNNTGDIVAKFTDLRVFERLRFRYDATSGGVGNESLTIRARAI